MPQQFCLVSMPRSGSNLLHTLLNSHPTIVCHGELFNNQAIYSALDRWQELSRARQLWSLAYRTTVPIRFLEKHLATASRRWHKATAIGFKLFPYHSRRVLRHVGESKNYRVVYLTRNNPILQYASDRRARQTNTWLSVEKNTARGVLDRVTFSAEDFQRYVSRLRYYDRDVRTTLGNTSILEVAYETLERSLTPIQEFLGVHPAATLRTGIQKQHSDDWQDRFTNPDDVMKALSKSEWEIYL
jgi:LPS sulfotransferase NodH